GVVALAAVLSIGLLIHASSSAAYVIESAASTYKPIPGEGVDPANAHSEQTGLFANLDFEAPPAADRMPPGWTGRGERYEFSVDGDVAHSGRQSGRIRLAAYGRSKGDGGELRSVLDTGPYRGGHVRFSGYLHTQGLTEGWAGLWLHFAGANKAVFAFDKANPPSVRGDTPWTRYDVVLPVPSAAESVAFGVTLHGDGTAWVDDFAFEPATVEEFRQFWNNKVASLAQDGWRTWFGVGCDLADLPAEEGYSILRENWDRLEKADVRRQMLKAWFFTLPYALHVRGHPRLLEVMDLGMRDESPRVRDSAISYLSGVAFQDFGEDLAAYRPWYEANRGRPLAEVFEHSLSRFVAEAATAEGEDLANRLGLLAHQSNTARDAVEARTAARAPDHRSPPG
ncbi:MAG: hypothetical protein GY953_54495, partial [bacterium]|nr:hypothetical protein [bacterium]